MEWREEVMSLQASGRFVEERDEMPERTESETGLSEEDDWQPQSRQG